MEQTRVGDRHAWAVVWSLLLAGEATRSFPAPLGETCLFLEGEFSVAPAHEPLGNTTEEHRLTRRDLFPLVGAAALAPLVAPSIAGAQETDQQREEDDERDDGKRAPSRVVYVGTYTSRAPGGVVDSTSKGVYVFNMNGRNGALSLIQVVELVDPSWVTIDTTFRHVYATSEVSTWKGTPNSGGITAYAVEALGKLSFINDQPTRGAIPAHVILDPSERFALVANYIGANFTVLPILSNGAVASATDVFAVTGKGPNTARQEAPHPHQTLLDPAGKYVFGPDLGTDKVWSWTLNTSSGKLLPNSNLPYEQVASGSGPRHMSFHPSGKFVYVLDEMVSSITAFTYDQAAGTFIWLQTVSTLPADFTGHSSTAEIIVHSSGKWVYASNRGHNTIATFRIDQATGKLKVINWTSTQGSIPRGFNIDPSGRLMLVGNQNSDTIVAFRINQNSGRLHPTGAITSTPVPVSIAFGMLLPG
jgi:6-phosphogluconolactonase